VGGFLHPPEWIRGDWENLMESNIYHIEHFTFLEGDIRYKKGFSAPEYFSAKYHGCKVQEEADANSYRLEFSESCGGDAYVFSRLNGKLYDGRAFVRGSAIETPSSQLIFLPSSATKAK
jgi:hypothetical protein